MKYLTSIWLILLCCVSHLIAQDAAGYKNLPPVTVTATTLKVPEKVWNNFSNYFNGAFVTKWYEINKKYLVKFMLDESENKALFTRRGALVYHISYGFENILSDDIRNAIKRDYAGYEIRKAIKISEDHRLVWLLTLEDSNRLLLIRLEDGVPEELEELNKNPG